MSTYDTDFNAIKADNPLETVIAKLGLTMKKEGASYRAQCPRCKQGARSLVVTPGKGAYCQIEKKGGDQIWLVSHLREVSLRDAAWFLNGGKDPEPTVPQNDPPKPRENGNGKEWDPEAYLSKLDPDHEALAPLQLDPEALRGVGGYSSRGVLAGTIAIACRDRKGEIIAFIGVPIQGSKWPKHFRK